MATTNQKVAAAVMMAVHTRIRATGLSLVWFGISLMSGGEGNALEKWVIMCGGEVNVKIPPSAGKRLPLFPCLPVVSRPRHW